METTNTTNERNEMTNEQLDAFYENIARVNEILVPLDKRLTAATDLADCLEGAGIEIRME